jgi:hypothetical protein
MTKQAKNKLARLSEKFIAYIGAEPNEIKMTPELHAALIKFSTRRRLSFCPAAAPHAAGYS